MTLEKNEKEYLLHILNEQLKQVKDLEKQPDDYFQSFAQEIDIHQFLNTLIDKVKKL